MKKLLFIILVTMCFIMCTYVKADDTVINEVTVNVPTYPTVGATVDAEYSVPEDVGYQRVTWNNNRMFVFNEGNGSTQVTGKYLAGESYYWSVVVCPKEGYAFPESTSDLNFTVTGIDVNNTEHVSRIGKTVNGGTCRGISIHFKTLPGTAKKFLTKPSNNEYALNETAHLSFSFATDAEIKLQKREGNNWEDIETFNVLAEEVKEFELTGTSVGADYYRLKYEDEDLTRFAEFSVTWYDPSKIITNVTVTLPKRPVVGDPVVDEFSIPDNVNYVKVNWNNEKMFIHTDTNGSEQVTGTYQEGISYDWSAVVCPKDDYSFPNTSEMTFTVNGIDLYGSYVKSSSKTVNGTTCRGIQIRFKELTVLNKPTITLTANNNKVTIGWEEQTAATKYEVYRSENQKKWSKLATVTSLSYINSNLTYGKTYYYKVRAYDGTSWTGYSNIVKKKIAPNKPTLSITSAGTNSIKVAWDKVSATGYEVYRSENNKKWTKVTTITKNSTVTFNNKKLKANKKYYYKVRVYKKVGSKKVYSSYSNIVSTKTAPTKPSVSLSLKSFTEMNIKIGTSKGASVYKVEKSIDGKTYIALEDLPVSGTLVASELEIGKTYYFRARACNSQDNCSGWTSANKKHTLKTPSLSLKSSYKGQVLVKIGNVDGAEGYAIEYSTNSKKGFKKVKNISSSSTSYLHESGKLKSKKTYYYRVRAYRVVDGTTIYGSWSKVQKVKINTKVLVKLKSIKLSVTDKIAVNDTKNVVVTYNPKDKVESITWNSSDETVAQVDNGKIIGLKPGNVIITATTSSGITSSVNVIIYKPAEAFTISSENINMYIGDTETLTATITPEDATFKNVNYKSMNTSIVTVSSDGLISAKAEGTTKIVVSTEEGISRECTVVVKERPIVYSGTGDSVISNINIPKGEYIARITINSNSYNSVKFYYGSGEYDYELLVNDTNYYSGTTLLKGGKTSAVNNGMIQIKTDGTWTITIEKLSETIEFPTNGNGDTVTGLFDGTGKQEIFNISLNSDSYHSVKIYKYNGGEYDYDLLVNETDPYTGKVMFRTEKGSKYFLVINTEGNWSITREQIQSSVSFPISGTGDMVTGLFDGTGSRIVFNITFNSDSYHSVKIYKYNGDEYDYDLLVNETDPYSGQVMTSTQKGSKYFLVIETEGSWTISK